MDRDDISNEIKVLGYFFIVIGAFALFAAPGLSVACLALTFGIGHILFGITALTTYGR